MRHGERPNVLYESPGQYGSIFKMTADFAGDLFCCGYIGCCIFNSLIRPIIGSRDGTKHLGSGINVFLSGNQVWLVSHILFRVPEYRSFPTIQS
jgi:hypothetical protein